MCSWFYLCHVISRSCNSAIITFEGEIHTLLKDKEEQGRGKKDKTNRHGAVDKSSSEQHFRKSLPSPLSCEISGALHLAQPGLTAGRLADKIQVNFKNFRIRYRSMCLTFRFV